MSSRRLITSLSPEVKINKYFFVFDIFVMAIVFFVAMMTESFFQYIPLKVIYIILLFGTAIWAISRPKHNPFKRNYQVLIMAFTQDDTVYHTIFPESEAFYNNDKKEDRSSLIFDTTADEKGGGDDFVNYIQHRKERKRINPTKNNQNR